MENVPTPAQVKTSLTAIRQRESEETLAKLNKLSGQDLRGLQQPTTPSAKPQDRKPKQTRKPHLTDRPFAQNADMAALQKKMNKATEELGFKSHNGKKPRRTSRPRGKN